MDNLGSKVICFGEILWDNLPTGRKPGGAPMNVAYHLNKLGVNSTLISRVGDDENGIKLLRFIEEKGLSVQYCQVDKNFPTSTVEVIIGADHEVKYDIVTEVAWDYIESDSGLVNLAGESEAFVFGSLAARNSVSYHTLNSLLEKAVYKVFDVNLREPHYDKNIISQLLRKTDLLKLNVHELNLISAWFCDVCNTEPERTKVLLDRFDIAEIVVTKGSSGASYYTSNTRYNYPAFKVKVQDTVGSGDSFLAAFLSQKLKKTGIEKALQYASALGAYVTMKSGACPKYQIEDLYAFISQQESSLLPFIKQ